MCNRTEHDDEMGEICPLDNPNEIIERCEDCPFWQVDYDEPERS